MFFSFRVSGLSYNLIIAENAVADHRVSLDFPQPAVAKGVLYLKIKACALGHYLMHKVRCRYMQRVDFVGF